MNSLSGFNSQEMRRLHPYLSALLRRLKELEVKVGKSEGVLWGRDEDILPTGNENLAGMLSKFARADHQHLFKFPTAIPLSTPDGSAFFDLSTSAINIYIGDTPTTRVVAGSTEEDVQPTGTARIGTAPRYSFADHSHPTAILPQNNNQSPVVNEIRFSETNQLVRWNGTAWINFPPQLADSNIPSNAVGVLARSPLTGTSGSRGWFLRGAQEDGSFRAPFAGFATFTASNAPAHSDLATNLQDGYGYFIRDLDRIDIVKPETDGNKYCTMLPHYIISVPCRIFRTDPDPSGHYIRDEAWNGLWTIAFNTTTSATTDLFLTFPNIAIPIGINGGRMLLYLHNPQSFAITTVFAGAVGIPTSTTPTFSVSPNISISIPANTTVVANLGYLSFPPSNTLSHHRSHLISIGVIRRRSQESANGNKVLCLGVVIVPQRAA
jgi:hypothetical protein